MRRALAILMLAAPAACEKSGESTPPTDAAKPEPSKPAPSPQLAAACIDRLAAWNELPEKPLPDDDVQLQGIQQDCGMLYAKCGGVETAAVMVAGGNRTVVLDLIDGCVAAYCGGFADPKPALCAGARAILTGSDKGAITRGASEFHAAMLGADVGGDAAALQPSVERLAELWTGYGSNEMTGISEVESLAFEVRVNLDGFELRVAKPHKWQGTAAGDSPATKLKVGLLPASAKRKGASAGDVDPKRWNYAVLGAEAKALRAAFPEEASVTLVVDEKVPNEVQMKAMDALRGKGCDLDPNAKPSTVPPQCMYWRQILR